MRSGFTVVLRSAGTLPLQLRVWRGAEHYTTRVYAQTQLWGLPLLRGAQGFGRHSQSVRLREPHGLQVQPQAQ